jgi:ketosteroid isomerase-like protein
MNRRRTNKKGGVFDVTDTELRELCHRFFDALERADVDTVAALYAPGMQMWVNLTGKEMSADENLKVLRDGAKLHRRRTYDHRTINTFDGGFIVQYSVNVVAHSGRRASLSACVIAQCRDGRITHLDEYLDSGKFAARAKVSTVAEGAPA